MNSNFNILNYIPQGYENAIKREELAIRTGLSDRKNRELIEEANSKDDIVFNVNNGYFRYKDEKDLIYMERYYKREYTRGWSNIKKSRIIRKFIDNKKQIKSEPLENQMDIFDFIKTGSE